MPNFSKQVLDGSTDGRPILVVPPPINGNRASTLEKKPGITAVPTSAAPSLTPN